MRNYDYDVVRESEITYRPLSTRTVIARKEHKCAHCGKTIKPGERYTRHAYMGEEGFSLATVHSMSGYCLDYE